MKTLADVLQDNTREKYYCTVINKQNNESERIIVYLTNDGKGNIYLSQDENSTTATINNLKRSFTRRTPIEFPFNNPDLVFDFEDEDYQYHSVDKL
ncbi:hypothetical protein [Fructobacillus tropaeoli]|uniref:hypothetical protein n=1 Tax=Fructobacillus tropaeoli TaxID=709323 RepID=UPI002DA915CD|nr:unnamed protein product [Fructobacillus tropaeoli]